MKDHHINFTKKAIEDIELPASGKRNYFYDTKIKGLELVVTDKGNKSFKVYKKFDGKPIRINIGVFPNLSVEQARRAAQLILADLAQGKNPNDQKSQSQDELTLGKMFKIFMERYSKPNKKTWKADEQDIPRFLGHLFDRKLSAINKQEIQLLHEQIKLNNGLVQANRLLSRFLALYNKAIEWGYTTINPGLSIKKFKERSRERFLHPDKLPRFLSALEEEENETIKDYIYISLLTGARKSNVLSMQWADVNMQRKEWVIPITKNGDQQQVHLVDKAIEILGKRASKYGANKFVFEGTGSTGHLIEPKKGWKRVLKRAGIENLCIHDLRRTLGSYQAALGANSYIIGKSLGHKSQAATAIYARLSLDPVKKSVEKATQAILKYAK
ncbi:tyrosine-type recombinase/integrase [Candidatus Trichorickettsia mobilis]|uniref:tyrosine-type recombinase/integrase n=1 Tax=Candidatus Trichorickettsia mobilis TaxID=1346319 RepID=UPI00292FDEDF|nr:tyrosine-type recombinase/integrase [Candidatus Trichorickettsia mobilis]